MSRADDASKIEWAKPPRIAPTKLRHTPRRLVGREEAIARLDGVWDDGRINVVVIQAWGGVGKTSLVGEWMARRAADDWRAARWVFDWTFYSQGTRADGDADKAVSADLFIAEALAFFGDPDPQAGSPWDRGARLAGLVAKERGVLVLDGVEPLQHPPGPLAGQLSDPALLALLKGLAQKNAGLCVVTTRERLVDLAAFSMTVAELARVQAGERNTPVAEGLRGSLASPKSGDFGYGGAARHKTVLEWPLDSLSDEAGGELLHALGVTRAGAATIEAHDGDLRTASREVQGHALTLQLMGNYLRLALDGDIRQRNVFRFAEADAQWQTNPNDVNSPYGHAFKVIGAYERWWLDDKAERTPAERLACRRQLAMLRLMGLFNRPADAGCLKALREPPAIAGLTDELVGLDDREWKITAQRLEDLGLVKRDPPTGMGFALDSHPLIRGYFASQLKSTTIDAWRAGHTTLYEHLRSRTSLRDNPTLTHLEPLCQAAIHACLANRYTAAYALYHEKISRTAQIEEGYLAENLGALGHDLMILRSLLDSKDTVVASGFALKASDVAYIKHSIGYDLHRLARLEEAKDQMLDTLQYCKDHSGELFEVRDGLQLSIQWESEVRELSNLSHLYLNLGRLDDAIRVGQEAIIAAAAGLTTDIFTSHEKIKNEVADWLIKTRARLADACANGNRSQRDDAKRMFDEAKELQVKYGRSCLQEGHWRCRRLDLELQEPERVMWRAMLTVDQNNVLVCASCCNDECWKRIEGVREEARLGLQEINSLKDQNVSTRDLDEAMLSLVSARTELLVYLFRESANLSVEAIDQCDDLLRKSRATHELPRALHWRAVLYFCRGDESSARLFLDEAWEIAARGPMPLHQADIHLTRARLFGMTNVGQAFQPDSSVPPIQTGDHQPQTTPGASPVEQIAYPWESVEHDLKEARRLIEKHGYHRRDAELADAEAALLPR